MAEVTREATTNIVIRVSISPCPEEGLSSTGLFAYFKPNRTSSEERVSIVGSIDSVMSA